MLFSWRVVGILFVSFKCVLLSEFLFKQARLIPILHCSVQCCSALLVRHVQQGKFIEIRSFSFTRFKGKPVLLGSPEVATAKEHRTICLRQGGCRPPQVVHADGAGCIADPGHILPCFTAYQGRLVVAHIEPEKSEDCVEKVFHFEQVGEPFHVLLFQPEV